jgi:hypothetical protein
MMRTPRSCSNGQPSALWIRALRTSMINRNIMRDNGSPWHNSRPWWIVSPGTPLRMICVLAVESRAKIHLHHTTGKPTNSSTSKRTGQVTESKALAMSILSSKQAYCLAWRSLAAECTNQKLSWM